MDFISSNQKINCCRHSRKTARGVARAKRGAWPYTKLNSSVNFAPQKSVVPITARLRVSSLPFILSMTSGRLFHARVVSLIWLRDILLCVQNLNFFKKVYLLNNKTSKKKIPSRCIYWVKIRCSVWKLYNFWKSCIN